MGRSHNYTIGFLLLFFQMQIGYGQSIGKIDSICWRTDYKIQWSDFTGIPPEETKWNAVCGSHIKAMGYRDGKLPNFRVIHYFVKQESWVRDTTSLILLEHERLHFDISEIFARRIRQAVDSLRMKGESKVDVYGKNIDSWLRVWDEWSEAYDEETSHGLRPLKQKEWVIKIQKELNALSKYATRCPPMRKLPG